MVKVAKTHSAGIFSGKLKLQCPHCKRETIHSGDFLSRNAGTSMPCGAIPNGNKAGCHATFIVPGQLDPSRIQQPKITHKAIGFLGLKGHETHLFCPYCHYETIHGSDFEETAGGQLIRCESCFDIYQMPVSAQQRADQQATQRRVAEAEARRQQEIRTQAEAETRRQRDIQAQAGAEARRQQEAQRQARQQREAQQQAEAQVRQQAELQRKAELKRQQEAERQKEERARQEQERKDREREERMNIARRQEADRGYRPPWDN